MSDEVADCSQVTDRTISVNYGVIEQFQSMDEITNTLGNISLVHSSDQRSGDSDPSDPDQALGPGAVGAGGAVVAVGAGGAQGAVVAGGAVGAGGGQGSTLFQLVSGPVIHGRSLGGGLYFGTIWCSMPVPFKLLPHYNPYKAFKERAALPFVYWNDAEQRYAPVSIMPAPLPEAKCEVSFSFHFGHVVYDLREDLTIMDLAGLPSTKIGTTLHNIYGDKKKPRVRVPSNYRIPEEDLTVLGVIGPEFKPDGGTSSNVLKRARRGIRKHLPRLLDFLTPESYWKFGIDAYMNFQMSGLLEHLYLNRGPLAVGEGEVCPEGWWRIRAMELIRLAHTYPPIHQNRAALSFTLFWTLIGWVPKGTLLAVTSTGEAAERDENVIRFEDGSPAVEFPFNELIWMGEP